MTGSVEMYRSMSQCPYLLEDTCGKEGEELLIPVYIRSRTTRSLEPPPASSSDSGEIKSRLLPR